MSSPGVKVAADRNLSVKLLFADSPSQPPSHKQSVKDEASEARVWEATTTPAGFAQDLRKLSLNSVLGYGVGSLILGRLLGHFIFCPFWPKGSS